jgi:energy-converting hydrogenase Eha subunit F
MKIKNDKKAPAPTTEAEALRKDPLKNYDQGGVGDI